MSFVLIDIPRQVPAGRYAEATGMLIDALSRLEGIESIVGFGNVSTPGISDIDLLAVFGDGRQASFGADDVLPEELRYLVTHNVAAMSATHFRRSARFTAWHKQETVWGRDLAAEYRHDWTPEESRALQAQTAVEFLVTNYIDLEVQAAYGIIKVRSLLQHVKALKFDLDFLGVTAGPVHDGVTEIREWIRRWFDMPPAERPIGEWLTAFLPEYRRFMTATLASEPLYLPPRPQYRMSANTTLVPGDAVRCRHRGFVLPGFLAGFGRKFFNLQHRLNRFEVSAPIVHEHAVALIAERYAFFAEVMDYHRRHFGRFITLAPTLPARVC